MKNLNCKLVGNWTDQTNQTVQVNLKLLSVGLIEPSTDSSFVSILNNKVADDKFYKETLFKELKIACQDEGYSLVEKMKNSVNIHGNQNLKDKVDRLNGITDRISVQETNLYPSINVGNFSEGEMGTPVIAYIDSTFDETDDDINIPGFEYQINGEGNVTDLTEIEVTSNYSEELIWLVKINESVNCKGKVRGVGRFNNHNCNENNVKWLEFFSAINFENCKENGFLGIDAQAEPRFAFIEYESNGVGDCDGVDDYLYKQPIYQKSSDHDMTCNRLVNGSGSSGGRSIHHEFIKSWDECHKKMALVVYERDNWPAGEEVWDPGAGGCYNLNTKGTKQNRDIMFRSFNDAWIKLNVEPWGHWVSTGQWQATNESYNVPNFYMELRGRPPK